MKHWDCDGLEQIRFRLQPFAKSIRIVKFCTTSRRVRLGHGSHVTFNTRDFYLGRSEVKPNHDNEIVLLEMRPCTATAIRQEMPLKILAEFHGALKFDSRNRRASSL